MIDLNNYYKILGVNPHNTLTEIKQAYHQLVKIHHPDSYSNNLVKQQAESTLKQINIAYEYLKKYHSLANTVTHNNSSTKINKSTPQDFYQQAIKLAQDNQIELAIASLTLAIKHNPQFLKAYQYRGFLLEKLGYKLRAKADFEQVTQLKQSSAKTPQTTTNKIKFTNHTNNTEKPMTQTLELNLSKTTEVAKKQIWLAVILSLFTGFGGYIYTARYRALLISSSIIFGLGIVTAIDNEEPKFLSDCFAVFLLTSLVDNATAIQHNREKIKIKQHFESRQPSNYYQTNPQALRVTLLRLIKTKTQQTITDLVITTGVDANVIRDELVYLQQQDLITLENRLEDGVMIYKLS